MQKLTQIEGKTIREWAKADLPYGAFEKMVRKIDPVYGIYAEAGAELKTYTVRFDGGDVVGEIEAYHLKHARRIARFDLGRSQPHMMPSVELKK